MDEERVVAAGAAGLPSGTVTLLFSDIAGSTRLLAQLGERYAQLLTLQREALRAAWAEFDGVELGTEGDSFYVVFQSPVAAVQAAALAQRTLQAQTFPGGVRVAVRIGLHTGVPTIHDGAYIGMDVHRAARIASAANGGQILLSGVTAELVRETVSGALGLRDLGLHQLKDMNAAMRLVQLVVPGLDENLEAPRSLGSISSLPITDGPLVGRSAELAQIDALLIDPAVRLLSLTGPGGSGKTRLALDAARRSVQRFLDGVFFVSLAAADSTDAMWRTIAEVLDLPPGGYSAPQVLNQITQRSMMLVLDNLEQITGADHVVSQILEACPSVQILATTRRTLRLRREHEFAVPPLPLPDGTGLHSAEHVGAVELFVLRAQRVNQNFRLTEENVAPVVAVCRALDGLPLAIELAAARTRVLNPAALALRLDRSLDLRIIAADRPTRQQTLRQTIAWSYELLTPEQQTVFRLLGVFAGGADLVALEAVVQACFPELVDDVLHTVSELADASLVRAAESVGSTVRIELLETMRAWARDELATRGELPAASQAHCQYYATVAHRLRALVFSADRIAARSEFLIEQDNLGAAMGWAFARDNTLGADRDPEASHTVRLGVAICADLMRSWEIESYGSQARVWGQLAVEQSTNRNWIEVALCRLGWARTLLHLGETAEAESHLTTAITLLNQLQETDWLPTALTLRGWAHLENGRLDAARDDVNLAITASREIHHWTPEVRSDHSFTMTVLGWVEMESGQYAQALDTFTRTAQTAAANNDLFLSYISQANMACVLRLMGRSYEAVTMFRRLLPLTLELREPHALITTCEDFAAALTDEGSSRDAVRLLGLADQLRAQHAQPRWPSQEREISASIASLKAQVSQMDWITEYQHGHNAVAQQLLTELARDDAAATPAARDALVNKPDA